MKDRIAKEPTQEQLVKKAVQVRDAAQRQPMDTQEFATQYQDLLNLVGRLNRAELVILGAQFSLLVNGENEYYWVIKAINSIGNPQNVFII